MATRADRASYRYCDFYCFMSWAEFALDVARDDDEGNDSFGISFSALRA